MLFIEDSAPVIVQGMTGHQGMTHTARMLKAGTNIVGGMKNTTVTMSTFTGQMVAFCAIRLNVGIKQHPLVD